MESMGTLDLGPDQSAQPPRFPLHSPLAQPKLGKGLHLAPFLPFWEKGQGIRANRCKTVRSIAKGNVCKISSNQILNILK